MNFARDIPSKAKFTIIDYIRKPKKEKKVIGVAEVDFSKYRGKGKKSYNFKVIQDGNPSATLTIIINYKKGSQRTRSHKKEKRLIVS